MYTVEQKTLLRTYVQRVVDVSAHELNLVGPGTVEETELLHLEDSLAGLSQVNAAPAGPLVDLGSGGGFPGVPLAVATGRKVTLVDSRAKKMRAVEKIVAELGLDNITCFGGRIEELAVSHREAFAVATARALAKLPVLLELASPLLCQGGRLVAYKSSTSLIQDELDAARHMSRRVGMSFCSCDEACVGGGQLVRNIVVFEKTGEPDLELPRRNGLAQKRPLT